MTSDTIFVRCPARLAFLASIRQAVVALCEGGHTAVPPSEAEVYQVQLAVSELVTNIVTHAYADAEGGEIEFAATRTGARVAVDVYDAGQPYTPAGAGALPDPDEPREGGYGLFIIAQAMDVFTHARVSDNRNHWHMEKQFAATRG